MRTFALVALSLLILTILPQPLSVNALPTADVNVPIEPGPTDARNPSLAVDANGVLHVVRSENKTSPRGAYYSRSADGVSWSPTVRVDGALGNVSFPRIVVEREAVPVQGRAYVAYQTEAGPNADVWFVSSDNGVSWSAPRRIDSAPANNASITPTIAATSGRLYAVWADNRDPLAFHVYFRGSPDGGATWGAEVQVSSLSATNLQPRIDAKGDTIAVAWRQVLGNGPAISVARSDDAGASWTTAVVSMAANPTANLFAPDVFVDDMLVAHVAWIESQTPTIAHAMYAWGHDGTSWSPPVAVDDALITPVSMRQASVSALAGTIWVAWDDNRAGDYDTYAAWSADGITWGDGVVNGNDLRLDDTDRNANPADDATIQVSPTLRTGGFGVFAVWDDARGGTYDTYATSVQVSPLVITEVQDTPTPEARVEIYNFGRTAFDFSGATMYAGASVVDLTPLGTWPARSHVVVGATGADLVAALDLGTEGALVRIERGADVLAKAGSGPYGIAPDPLGAESTARFAGTLDYVTSWTRSVASTFGARNLVPPPNLAPPVVLNEVLFNPAAPGDLFAEIFARTSADLTGYRLVADSVYTFSGGLIDGANPYAFFFESAGPGWWAALDAATDNLYLYDASGRLLDMFGWDSAHTAGLSATRNAGVGGSRAHDDPSAVANGWSFDAVPSLALVGLAQDSSILTDIGTTIAFLLTATNRQSVPEVINVDGTSAMPNWPVTYTWTNGTPLSDSAADPDATPDLGVLGPSGSASFLAEVQIPSVAPLGDGNTIIVSASAASKAVARASVRLRIGLSPHFDIYRTVIPGTVYLEGSGSPYNEVANVTILIEGAGLPVEIQVPQDVIFQIDVSGSMNSNDPSNVRVQAVNSYIGGMRVDDRASIVGFSDVAWVVNGRPLTYTTLPGKIDLMNDANTTACSPGCFGGTNIDDALQVGNTWLITYSDRTRTRVEILLTDGQCTVPAGLPCPNTNAIVNQAVTEGIVIYTIGLGSSIDQTFLENIAIPTGGRFYQASTPQDLLQIYADIGTRINRTAGVDPDPTDVTPMVADAILPYLNVVPGSFVDPMSGMPRPPEFMVRLADRTVLQWNVSSIDINETWAVQYGVTSTRLGVQAIGLSPDARATYVRWDNSTIYQEIPQGILEVLAATTPPFITATTPVHGAVDVALDATIRIEFSEDMDSSSVAWTVAPSVATNPVWVDTRTLDLVHQAFSECMLYTVTVTSGTDLDGTSLGPGPVPNPWLFWTVCPTYVSYTITRSPDWGVVQVDGTDYTVPATFVWQPGELHRIASIDFDSFGGSRLAFLGWDDGGAIDHTVTVGSVDATITANYALQHPATLTLIGLSAAWPAGIGFTLFGSDRSDRLYDSFASWVDDASALDVDGLVPGVVGERFLTADPTLWTVDAPLSATVHYLHQFTTNVRVAGLDGLPVSLDFTAFAAAGLANVSDAWTAWVDAGSAVRVDDAIFPGERERYRTLGTTEWRIDAPLDTIVSYRHQYRPRVTILGTDERHSVTASWSEEGIVIMQMAVIGGVFPWADAARSLEVSNRTTGDPPRFTQNATRFTVNSAFDVVIVYMSQAAPPAPLSANWKPLLALVYATGLFVAGVTLASRPLDRHVPMPKDGDRKARALRWAGLPLMQKLEELSIPEIDEKVTLDRRFTRMLLAVPFAVGEAAIGVLSLTTGVFRIPEAGNWLPLGFWANTAVLTVGLVVALAIWRKGYRMSEADLLALVEAREGKPGPTQPIA